MSDFSSEGHSGKPISRNGEDAGQGDGWAEPTAGSLVDCFRAEN